MKTIFQFRDGSHLTGDAQAVGERLEQIRGRRDGLTADSVVKDASNIRSVLHAYFEWDDVKAAEQHRLTQARELIRAVHVVFEAIEPSSPRAVNVAGTATQVGPVRAVRAFVAIEREDGQRAYESTQRALSDATLRRQVIARAHSELDSVARKYRELNELADVFQALDKVAEQLREPTAAM